MKLSPYLMFDGSCERAFTRYGEVLGGSLEMMRFGDAPAEAPVPPETAQKIMHASLTIGEQVLMGSDTPTGEYQGIKGMSLAVRARSAAEADRLFEQLAEGGTVTLAMTRTFWAERFGMLVDRFGVAWMIAYQGSPG